MTSSPSLFYIPVEVLSTPVDGRCICGAWWVVHPELGAVFAAYGRDPSPQCNVHESIVRDIASRLYPDCAMLQIPVAYMTHAERELGRLLIERASRLQTPSDINRQAELVEALAGALISEAEMLPQFALGAAAKAVRVALSGQFGGCFLAWAELLGEGVERKTAKSVLDRVGLFPDWSQKRAAGRT